jgi:replication factor C large subunit
MNLPLVEKYRITKVDNLIGQSKAVQSVKEFLDNFPKKKALVLYGPAGTGKTSLVLSITKEKNLEIFELNSSDLRNRAQLEERLKPASAQQSLFKKSKILLMDEVDGVTGSDIGGIPELARLISTTNFPIIMTCNDVWQSKLSPIREKAKLVEMKALKIDDIIKVLNNVCEKENLTLDYVTIKQIAIKSQGDIRAAINDLQSYSNGESLIDLTEKRDVEESIFNILRKIFKERQDFLNILDNTSLSLDEVLLWLEENIPKEYKNEALAKAYYSLAKADVFRGRIYKNQSWRFLIYQSIFQTAGISYAKNKPSLGFTAYERPKRILKIWLQNQKINKKKTIAKKYARLVHCSTKRALSDFELIKPMLKNPITQNKLQLSDDEIEFLNK